MGRMADGIEVGGRNALAVSYQSGPEKQKTIVSMSINGGPNECVEWKWGPIRPLDGEAETEGEATVGRDVSESTVSDDEGEETS